MPKTIKKTIKKTKHNTDEHNTDDQEISIKKTNDIQSTPMKHKKAHTSQRLQNNRPTKHETRKTPKQIGRKQPLPKKTTTNRKKPPQIETE